MEINSRKENLKSEIPHREQQIEILADILQSVRLVMILGMFTSNIYENVIEFICRMPFHLSCMYMATRQPENH